MEAEGTSVRVKRGMRPRARIVMLAIVLALGIGIAGHAMRPNSNTLPAGTSAFAKGHGVEYRSPDGSYTARFPKAPTVTHDAEQLEQYTVTIAVAAVTTDDYEIATTSIALPDAPEGSLATQLLNDALHAGIAQVGGTGAQTTSRTRGSLPALQATFKAGDGYPAQGLVMLDGNRLFELFVHARLGSNKLFDALDKSFVPTAGA